MPPKFLAQIRGKTEDRASPGTGLCRRDFRLHLVSDQTAIVNLRPVGGVASAAVTVWTPLLLKNLINPYGGTLVAQIIQASNTTGTFQLRVRGFDNFHEYIEEVTPVISFVSKTNNFIYLAQPFTYITEVAYMSTGLDVAGDTLSVGSRWDWTRTNDATNEHIAGRNLGFALPIRTGRRTGPKRAGGDYIYRQRTGPALVGTAAAAGTNQAHATRFIAPERHAAGAVVMTGLPLNNETITVDGRVYTWKAALTPAANEVLIGASASATLDNLAAAIIKAPSGGDVKYGAATTVHPTVTVGQRGLSGADQALVLVAKEPGSFGNTLTLTEASTNTTVTSFSGGFEGPLEVTGLSVYDITGSGAANALSNLQPTQFAVGLNEPGWVPAAEKIHILTASSVSQWATTDNILVDMFVRSAAVPL